MLECQLGLSCTAASSIRIFAFECCPNFLKVDPKYGKKCLLINVCISVYRKVNWSLVKLQGRSFPSVLYNKWIVWIEIFPGQNPISLFWTHTVRYIPYLGSTFKKKFGQHSNRKLPGKRRVPISFEKRAKLAPCT